MPMRVPLRGVVAASLLATVLACGSTPAPTADASSPPTGTTQVAPPRSALETGHSAWVSVSVARLWRSPSAPWAVDAPALERPVRFRAWLRNMSLSQRRALYLRSDTEALLGDRVVVVRLRPRWAKVVVPSQPTPKNARGYPGWVPRRQLTAVPPQRTAQVATVTSRTTWLRSDDSTARKRAEISFGTKLPLLGRAPGYVRVSTPRGAVRRVAAAAVVVRDRGAAALPPRGTSLVRTAKTFLGLPYLWGGLSGFGVDCSGLTWLVHRAHGIRIPRDALPQSRHGQRVSSRLPGDLLFYARNGVVHHVSMYVGDGQIIHAPRTGEPVQIAAFSAQPLRGEYVGARRYLD